jgi:hypothetical protein
MTWFDRGLLRQWYGIDRTDGGDKREAEMYRNYMEFLLQHRLGPGGDCADVVNKGKDGRYDFTQADATLQWLIGRGMNAFIMGTAPNLRRENKKEYSQEFTQQFTGMIKAYGEHLRVKGWLDRAYVYVYDEAPKEAWPEVKKIDHVIKEAAPGLRILQCLNDPDGVKDLAGWADVFDVYLSQYHQTGVAQFQKNGSEAWLALCCYPMNHPNFFVEYPLLDIRVTPWFCWKYKASGFEYWSPNAWGTNSSRNGQKWPKVPWTANAFGHYNGDGYLLYPGEDGKPCSSIRLEALREGLEDYEYLWTLDDLVKKTEDAKIFGPALEKARALLTLQAVIKENGSYAADPERYFVYRRELAETILILKSLLAPE